jgi:hypothetical protein
MGIDKDLIWFLLWIPITVIDKELIRIFDKTDFEERNKKRTFNS